MNRKEKVLVGLLVLIMVGIFGCASFQDVLTPAYIDQDAIDYSDENPKMFMPWTTLWDAKRIKRAVEQAHILNQEELRHGIKQDKLFYSFVTNSLSLGIADASELKNNLFSPSGTVGLLFPALTGVGIGWLGISKPSDKKKLNGNV